MAVSQFTIYSSRDVAGPGPITGSAGTVLNVLNQCLCSGYTGKAAAGWVKPYADSSNHGVLKQGAGAQLYCIIWDNAASDYSAKEYWAQGTNNPGTSFAQAQNYNIFPTITQLTTWSVLVERKSSTADGTTQWPWWLFADASTFYFFIATGDTTLGAGGFFDFCFGDIYSYYGSADANRVIITGRNAINQATVGCGYGGLDELNTPYTSTAGGNNAVVGYSGRYMYSTYAGTPISIPVWLCGDLGKVSTQITTTLGVPISGNVPRPSLADGQIHMSPIYVYDSTGFEIRGRMRGLYHICHPASSFQSGVTFSGSGDYAGKTFMVLCPGANGGIYCIETSNTVETN
jgi:hypothetical protein